MWALVSVERQKQEQAACGACQRALACCGVLLCVRALYASVIAIKLAEFFKCSVRSRAGWRLSTGTVRSSDGG